MDLAVQIRLRTEEGLAPIRQMKLELLIEITYTRASFAYNLKEVS